MKKLLLLGTVLFWVVAGFAAAGNKNIVQFPSVSIQQTNWVNEQIISNAMTLGGVRRTTWPSGGSAPTGTVVASGTGTIGQLLTAADTTGTNGAWASGVSVGSGTNLTATGDITARVINLSTNVSSIGGSNCFWGSVPLASVFYGFASGNPGVIGADDGSGHSGFQNSGFGIDTFREIITGYNNTAVGARSMSVLTNGYWNSGLGVRALWQVTSGYENTAIGVEALKSLTTGDNNTAIGRNALTALMSGQNNTAVGANAAQANLGWYNAVLGDHALFTDSSGSFNTAIGYQSQYSATTASYNTSLGSYAQYYNQTGEDNVILGYRAGFGVSGNSYSKNLIAGRQSGEALTTGSNNILLGYKAGDAITSGANNIIIGHDVDAPVATNSNQLVIGNLVFGTGIDGTGTTYSSGNVGIGTNAPSQKLEVQGNIKAQAVLFGTNVLSYDGTNLTWNGTAIAVP